MPIYVGNQKINMSGMDKVYVGTTLVYQKNAIYVVSIATTGQTTEYNINATFSYNGTCTATYSDGHTAVVTPTVSSPDMSTAGTKTVTLTYTEDGHTVTTSYNITVYQTYTISYRKAVYDGSTPATKTVRAGYTLKSSDLPTATESTTWSLTGWSTDGTNKVNAGTAVNSNIVLKAIHKGTITTANLFKQSTQSKYLEESGTVTVSSASMGNVGNFSTSTSSNTYALSRPSYSHSWNNYGQEGYCCVAHGAWGGIVATLTLSKSARVEWTPSTSSVTFTLPNGYTSENNYTGCYPGMVMRHTGTKAKIWGTSQNNTNKISHTSGAPNSGSTITVYCQYGGNNGSSNSQQLARRTGYKSWQSSSSSGSVTCSKSTASETIYIYTQG